MSNSSLVNEKQKVGEPISRSSACDVTSACIANAVSKIAFAYLRYPSRPSDTIDAQLAASIPLDREPSIPGEQYFPPLQLVWKKYWPSRNATSRNSSSDVPFRLYPYLWVSAEIVVTPGTR